MQMSDLLALATPLDLAALAIVLLAWAVIGWVTDHPPARHPSVSRMMAEVHRAWMADFLNRDNRILDGQIVTSLRQGTSFFASTCLLAIGGVLALIGNTAPIQGVAAEIGTSPAPALLWQVRLAPVALFLTHGFLKFVWAHRIFGYGSVMMAAVPVAPTDPAAPLRAAQAAELNIRGMLNFNAGLRSMYFALAALGWLFGPWGLIGATLAVCWLLGAREFWSNARDVVARQG